MVFDLHVVEGLREVLGRQYRQHMSSLHAVARRIAPPWVPTLVGTGRHDRAPGRGHRSGLCAVGKRPEDIGLLGEAEDVSSGEQRFRRVSNFEISVCVDNSGLCIKDSGFCIKNRGFCFENKMFCKSIDACIKNERFVSERWVLAFCLGS